MKINKLVSLRNSAVACGVICTLGILIIAWFTPKSSGTMTSFSDSPSSNIGLSVLPKLPLAKNRKIHWKFGDHVYVFNGFADLDYVKGWFPMEYKASWDIWEEENVDDFFDIHFVDNKRKVHFKIDPKTGEFEAVVSLRE